MHSFKTDKKGLNLETYIAYYDEAGDDGANTNLKSGDSHEYGFVIYPK